MQISKRWLIIIFSVMLVAALTLVGWGTTLLMQQRDTTETALVSRVIDGDTIEIEGGQTVRYIGIDTPEKGEYFFEEATAKNSELVLGKEVRLEKDVSETDQYGRLLRYVYVGDLFVNAELVRLGYAREAYYPPDTMHSDEFLRLEKYAADSDLGLYNEPKDTYVPIYTPKSPFKTQEPAGVEEPTYKANEVIEVVKASVPYFAQPGWYSELTCSVERETFGNTWQVTISGYRVGEGHFSETWYFHEDTGKVSRWR
jgi:micrococcal nuclease